ncbi:hypothetical protein EC991_011383 [Linnemannia zychae]|nr:hypothetical protein EC991_011383 [Linnemannia zychae]
MKTFGSLTIAITMMVALTVAFIASPADAATRFECMGACGKEYQKCTAESKPNCTLELSQCTSDCDG